ncbi:hypothetical protein SDC9_113347 [bioreactor metagenome]|uniref:Uncharacterized protein n=1 Tax=bioreactor metagenome TaxID=1076179 RepID=A0A645BLT7_9ZZZZ
MPGQTFAHHHHIRAGHPFQHFPGGIGQQAINRRNRALAAAAPKRRDTEPAQCLHDFAAAFGMARHQHQPQRRQTFFQLQKGPGQQFLLTGMSARAQEHRTGGGAEIFAPVGRRQIGRDTLIEFEIAATPDHRLRRYRAETFGIGVGLRRDHIELRQKRREKAAEPAIAARRTVRHPRIDQGRVRSGAMRLKHQIGPDFSFQNHQQFRLKQFQRPAHHPAEIERTEDRRRALRQLLAHQILPRGRSGREHHFEPGVFGQQFFDQRQCDHAFTHADRVDPDAAAIRRQLLPPRRAEMAEPFAEGLFPARTPPQFPQQPRNEKQKADRHEKIVQQHHQAHNFLPCFTRFFPRPEAAASAASTSTMPSRFISVSDSFSINRARMIVNTGVRNWIMVSNPSSSRATASFQQ